MQDFLFRAAILMLDTIIVLSIAKVAIHFLF